MLAVLACPATAQNPAMPPGQRWQSGFVANAGQWPSFVHYVASFGDIVAAVQGRALFVARKGKSLDLGAVTRIAFDGVAPSARIETGNRLPGVRHYLVGDEPAKWYRDVAAFDSVRWHDSENGIDVVLTPRANSLEVRFEVAAGGPLDQVRLLLENSRDPSVQNDGALQLDRNGELPRWSAPRAWQFTEECAPVPCNAIWNIGSSGELSVAVPQRDAALGLVIEAGLEWATFLGGTELDFVQSSALSEDGRIILAGHTWSVDFPATTGSFDGILGGTRDAFVAAIDPATMSLEFASYLGGSSVDEARAVALQGDRIVIAGITNGNGFPSTPGAFDESQNGFGADVFVTELTPDGSDLKFSTYLGGNNTDTPHDLVMAKNGDVIVAGTTSSPDFPVTPGALQHAFVASDDAFVTRIRGDGAALVWSANLGGSSSDGVRGMCLSTGEDVILCGGTLSPDFPYSPLAWQVGGDGPFVLRISHDGTTLLASTAFGGTLPSTGPELTRVVRIDPQGNIVVAGETTQFDFPTTPGVFQPQAAGSVVLDGFIIAFDSMLTRLAYATYLGGFGQDGIHDLSFDSAGGLLVSGTTQSSSFPVTPGCLDGQSGGADVFVSRLSPGCQYLWYSTYLGGTGSEKHQGLINQTPLAVTTDGGVIVAHYTNSVDYPVTPGAVQPTLGGAGDVGVAKLTLLPLGCERYGTPSPDEGGELTIGVTAMPQVGNADFSVLAGAVPPSSAKGFLLLGLAPAATAFRIAGIDVWVDLSMPYFLAPVASDDKGACQKRLSIPPAPGLAGFSAYAQFVWMDSAEVGGFAATRGLAITIQP